MNDSGDFLATRLGATGWPVFHLGLSATYRPGEHAIRRGLDKGINYLFCFGIDTQMTRVVRSLEEDQRERVLIATGGYNWIITHSSLKKSLDHALRRLRTDYIDVFHFLGVMKGGQFPERIQDELAALRDGARVRAVAVSCHDRRFVGEIVEKGAVDVLMVQYNAAHPGAEAEVFPHTGRHGTGVVAYTATRWTHLLRRPKGWPASEPVATAGECYRFVLSNPHVHVCVTAPRSERELVENLRETRRGPLPEDQMQFLRRFGAQVRERAGWFMGG